jgi:hypothetical protein
MKVVAEYFSSRGAHHPGLVAAGTAWRELCERPRDVVQAGDVIAVRSHVIGTTAAGVQVEFEPLTVLRADDALTCIDSWRERDLPALAIVSRYFEATNSQDWEALSAVWSWDGRLDAVGGPPRKGRENAIGAYRRFHDMFVDHIDHVGRVLICGRTATVTGRFNARNHHGVPIEFEWLDLFELTEDERLIQRLWHWHDRDLARRLMDKTE